MPGRWNPAGRAPAISTNAGQSAMPVNAANDDPEKARRFRDAALPYLDDAYTLARYLLREPADAERASASRLGGQTGGESREETKA